MTIGSTAAWTHVAEARRGGVDGRWWNSTGCGQDLVPAVVADMLAPGLRTCASVRYPAGVRVCSAEVSSSYVTKNTKE